jgi:hypothetical protein
VSDNPTSGPAGAGGVPGQPSEEELREALGQLRGAPVDQVVAEVASALLNAAQVKLGRRDGRLLIDVTGVITDRVRGHVPDELTRQLDDVLTQLRLAQVEAEGEVQAATAQGHQEPNDLARTPGPDQSGGAGAGEGATPSEPGSEAPPGRETPPSGPSPASRLWVPGR